jgi:hypothetical protein
MDWLDSELAAMKAELRERAAAVGQREAELERWEEELDRREVRLARQRRSLRRRRRQVLVRLMRLRGRPVAPTSTREVRAPRPTLDQELDQRAAETAKAPRPPRAETRRAASSSPERP